MLGFLARRLAFLLFTLWLVSVITFGVTQILPGDVARAILGQEATPEDLARLHAELGLDRPAPERYVTWLSGVLRGDPGKSLRLGIPAGPLIWERLQRSLVLGGLTFIVAVPLALALGVVAGLYRDRLPDYAISMSTLVAVSLPEFVTGSVLILVVAAWLGLLPPTSMQATMLPLHQALPYLVLPVATLTLVMLAHTARMARASMIEVMSSPYIRTAILKGLPWWRVVLRHALPNALVPAITVVAMNTGWLIGGLVVVENVCGYAGLGRLLVEAIQDHDVPVLQAIALIIAAIYGIANLCADVLYTRLNPRIRYA
jgi:peptide/nickel transport system permease protein